MWIKTYPMQCSYLNNHTGPSRLLMRQGQAGLKGMRRVSHQREAQPGVLQVER